MSLDSDASGKEANLNQKPKLGAEHMAHSSCIEGGMSSFEGIWRLLMFLFHMEYLMFYLCSLSHLFIVSFLPLQISL